MKRHIGKNDNHMRRRRPPKPIGRHAMLVAALALLMLTGYELYIRMDDFIAWTSGVKYLSDARGESFIENMTLVFSAPRMQELAIKLMFLILSAVYAIFCIIKRSRPRAALPIMIMGCALTAAGWLCGIYDFNFALPLQLIKLIPMALMIISAALDVIQGAVNRRRLKSKPQSGSAPKPLPAGKVGHIDRH